MQPHVTVLTPVYNGLPYLRETIESVLAQTFGDFEYLIIDDASTDDSAACVMSYRDLRIRLVRNERNLGTAGSMNRGTAMAQTPYIARIDQDDVCLPDRLRLQFAHMERHPDLAATCTWEYGIDAFGRRARNWRRVLDNYGAFLGYLVVGKSPIWHPSIMFRRQALQEVGGYNGAYSPAEDFELTMRLALRRYQADIVPEYLVRQRQHGRRQTVVGANASENIMRRVHREMVDQFCPHPAAEMLALLLRMEEGFWRQCRSKPTLESVVQASEVLRGNLRTSLRLSAREDDSLSRVVFGRLGPGARLGRQLAALPSPLCTAAFYGLSPLLIPGVRRVVSVAFATAQQARYPGRLIRSGLDRLTAVMQASPPR